MLSRKQAGFLGPIGDDLPSLVPLIFALVIFFSTFAYAMNAMDSRNDDFDADLSALAIARIMRSNGYLTDHADFMRLCGMINVAGLNYEIALVETELTYEQANYGGSEYAGIDVFDLRVFDATPNAKGDEADAKNSEFYCSNLPEPEELIKLGQKISSRAFPVVLEHGNAAKPMFLVVITWKP